MVITACHCNWDIPGVEALPAHNHVFTGGLVGTGRHYPDDHRFFAGEEIMQLEVDPDKIHIWVPWKEVARA